MINTLITIKDAIELFVEQHEQLKSVVFEADDQRANYITENNEFPLLFVAPIDVNVGRAMNTHTLRIYVYERVNHDRTDVWENANDTSLILRDIRVWWNDYGNDDIHIIEDPIGQFGSDRELDKLIGYFADIRFEIPSHGRCDVPINVTPTPNPTCADANYVVEYADGTPIESGTIPSGGSVTVVVPNCPPAGDVVWTLFDKDGNVLDSGTEPAGGTLTIVAPDATFDINGVQVATIRSGGTDSIQVLQGGLEVGSLVGDNWVVPVCAPATIQLTSPSGVLQTVTGASGSTTSQTLRTIGRMPYKTGSSGASTPPVNGVDGLTQRGRNFLTLDYNNAWGNTNRFTWKNGTQTYPNGVTAEGNGYAVDNSTWDRNGKVLLIAYVTTTRTFANQATTALATTIDGMTGWEMINAEELSEITTGNSVANKQANYAPFNIPEGTIIITSTEAVNNNTQCLTLTTSGVEGSISKAGLRHTFFVRLATLTIDSLGNVTIS